MIASEMGPRYSQNTLRPERTWLIAADNISKCVLIKENICDLILISMKSLTKGRIYNWSQHWFW